ncbi:uncharacterized protein LOC100908718 isoform X1 [Galendromus occidentalis]|uniref:Uncharacterized protein LOC100908718 isoform X1 n=1 Tax=Galendromus occidentalis TaxID=34638 RepID=A0AAJ7SK09_9ACAR|nr:uncharacterized protein LOC100908718 isoform X1 [Galendromus occidentalis]
MSVSLLKKTALLMGDLQESKARKAASAKELNKVKLVKLSSKEKQTRRLMGDMRKRRMSSNADLSKSIARVQRFSEKINGYTKKALANDLVRRRIFKNQAESSIPLKSEDDDMQESAFTEEDFKRFDEEYNIKFTTRARERAEIQKYIK